MRVDKEKIKLAMAREIMSREDVAEKAGIPLATFVNVMVHETARPATAGKIAKALNVDVTEILSEKR